MSEDTMTVPADLVETVSDLIDDLYYGDDGRQQIIELLGWFENQPLYAEWAKAMLVKFGEREDEAA